MSQEQELKLAADAVLCEVRKKQADVKRMQDVLRSLEKLRRLRKEAASRKGEGYCCTECSLCRDILMLILGIVILFYNDAHCAFRCKPFSSLT